MIKERIGKMEEIRESMSELEVSLKNLIIHMFMLEVSSCVALSE